MPKDFNQLNIVENYDQHIRKLIPAYELVHQQIEILLRLHLGENPHVLIVGCGTGQELIQLAQCFPTWQFTAIDPAENMIKKVEEKLKTLNLPNKIELLCADTSILTQHKGQFDAALSILVAHFVQDKIDFFKNIYHALKFKGICINYDLMQLNEVQDAECLKQLAEFTGLHPKQSQAMLAHLKEDFYLISIEELQKVYLCVGFRATKVFSQIFNYYALIAYK